MTATYDSYMEAMSAADGPRVCSIMEEEIARGETSGQLIHGYIAPGQSESGRRWAAGLWSVADEHAATTLAEQALTLVAPPGSQRPARNASRVVIACVEGEWHTMPARLAAELARGNDLDVVMLGGNMPTDSLRGYLRATRPAAVALSVTMPSNLISAAACIDAAHQEGVPVIVGGAAWGDTDARAQRLGADLRLADPENLGPALAVLDPASLRKQGQIPDEARAMASAPDNLMSRAFELQLSASPALAALTPKQRSHTVDDYRWLARYAGAAVACQDDTIVDDLLVWLLELLVPRGVQPHDILDGSRHLADAVAEVAPLAAGVLRSAPAVAEERWAAR